MLYNLFPSTARKTRQYPFLYRNLATLSRRLTPPLTQLPLRLSNSYNYGLPFSSLFFFFPRGSSLPDRGGSSLFFFCHQTRVNLSPESRLAPASNRGQGVLSFVDWISDVAISFGLWRFREYTFPSFSPPFFPFSPPLLFIALRASLDRGFFFLSSFLLPFFPSSSFCSSFFSLHSFLERFSFFSVPFSFPFSSPRFFFFNRKLGLSNSVEASLMGPEVGEGWTRDPVDGRGRKPIGGESVSPGPGAPSPPHASPPQKSGPDAIRFSQSSRFFLAAPAAIYPYSQSTDSRMGGNRGSPLASKDGPVCFWFQRFYFPSSGRLTHDDPPVPCDYR